MKAKYLLVMLLAIAVAAALLGCPKKEKAAETAATAVTEAPPVEEEAPVASPETAGATPVTAPPDVAKVQLLDGLEYTVAVVGWDNPFAATLVGRALANLETLAPTAEGNAKDAVAKAQLDLGGVKTMLEDVVAKKGTLTQEELNALKDTLTQTRKALAAVYEPAGGRVGEAQGDKLKEGHRMKEEKSKEGGDLKKQKWSERGGK